jgi:hypothetical protein
MGNLVLARGFELQLLVTPTCYGKERREGGVRIISFLERLMGTGLEYSSVSVQSIMG